MQIEIMQISIWFFYNADPESHQDPDADTEPG